MMCDPSFECLRYNEAFRHARTVQKRLSRVAMSS
jgi:hypothetical protein